MYRKKLKDLTIRDNFMFTAVMSEEANCKPFLEMLLGIEIDRIEVSYEKSFFHNPEFKGVRLDVYAKDEHNTRYDIEMQVGREHLGKRVRYYHGEIDRDLLKAGHLYENLPATYVIFICNFDPFHLRKYCYIFENRCLQDYRLPMGDEARSIFLSTVGENPEEIPDDLRAFLDFIKEDLPDRDIPPENDYIRRIQQSMHRIKQDGEMERRYMFIHDMTREAEAKGKAEGISIGELNAKRQSILELLEDYGTISESLYSHIMEESDSDRLKAMHKAAAKAKSIAHFESLITNL